MTATTHPLTGTAIVVARERAAANHLLTTHRPAKLPPAALPLRSRVPTRRRVERIAVRYAPRPPQTSRKSVSTSPRSRKSLVVNRKIKAQPATHPRP